MGEEAAELEQTPAEDELNAALSDAWDSAEDETETEQEAAPAGEAEPAPEPVAIDETPPATVDDPIAAAAQPQADDMAAPVGLPPEAREAWKDTPKAMRTAIAKREKEFSAGIQHYAEQAKRADGMDKTLAPFQQYLAMNGGAGPTIQTLLQTGAGLQMGSPMQKAQVVAGIIKQYGIDISTLDNMLVGEAPPQGQQQSSQIQQAVSEALQPFQQFMGGMQQQQQQQQQNASNQITTDINTFAADPKHEFYSDVKMDMADLLDMAANRGQDMTLDQAYEKACQIHPQISKIMTTRSAVPTPQKRAAAASITGGPGGPGATGEPGDLRNAIEDAWSNAGQVQ